MLYFFFCNLKEETKVVKVGGLHGLHCVCKCLMLCMCVCRQQRGLLKMLSKIDDSLTEANGSGFNKPVGDFFF